MKLVEFNSNIPEENIALDEMLLQKAEADGIGESLRFWESRTHFVVLGRSGKIKEDCFPDKCESGGIKIIRRISGGGTVLQGEGCLNYSLVLSYEKVPEYTDINASYRKILSKMIEQFRTRGQEVEFMPISDIAIQGKKISGNAQARKKKFFLHHGTLLYDFDLGLISEYLQHPGKEPDYRQNRSHKDFVDNISLIRTELEEAVKEVFGPDEEIYIPSDEDIQKMRELVETRYSDKDWNYAF
jgi:lipoate-protein ligase A